MFKKSIFISVFFIVIPLVSISARGIIDDSDWENIEFSENFTWYNVLYNQKGEKIGLEETNNPNYGQDIEIIYKTDDGLLDGKLVRISVYDRDFEYVFNKSGVIKNGELVIETRLLSNKHKLENLESENELQYFCVLTLPDSKKVRSGNVNVNFTLTLEFEFYEDELDERVDIEVILESTDGEYRQTRNILKEGMIYGEHRIQRLIFNDIKLFRNYNLDYGSLYMLAENFNILDFLDYYDE